MKIIDHYIRRTVIMTTLLVSLVIIGMESFLSLIQQMRYVGENGYTLLQAFLAVPMQMPVTFYQLFPMVGFLGAMIGLSRLSASSQLIAMRASGVSIVRIAWSVVKAALIMIVVITVIGEVIGPHWQQESIKAEDAILYPELKDALLKSIWLRHDDMFTHIGALKNENTLLDITRYQFAKDGKMLRATQAKTGHLVNGHWQLSQLKHSVFAKNKITVTQQDKAPLHFAFQPTMQVEMRIAAAEQTLPTLYRTIHYRRSIGLTVSHFVFSFWQRALQPLSSLIMICLAVPFVFGSLRDSSMGMRIMLGILVGFGFYMLNQLFGPVTMVYQFPPVLAAIMPTVIFFVIALVLLLRVR